MRAAKCKESYNKLNYNSFLLQVMLPVSGILEILMIQLLLLQVIALITVNYSLLIFGCKRNCLYKLSRAFQKTKI